MPTYVALLRGINVGTGRKVPMAELRETFDELGHTDVRTYIQSGNVVFTTTAAPAKVRATVESALERDYGFAVTVLLRTPAELASVVKRNPYGGAAYVTFLDGKPDPKQAKTIDPTPFAPDEFTVSGREVFVRCPNGYGRTKINNTFFERKLATKATTRNWKTVTTLLDWTKP